MPVKSEADAEKARKAQKYTNTYESQFNAQTIAAVKASSLRSFMAEGDVVFANEIVEQGTGGAADITRDDVILKVRNNILRRMDEVNNDSQVKSLIMKNDQRGVSLELIDLIETRKGLARARKKAEFEVTRLTALDREKLAKSILDYVTAQSTQFGIALPQAPIAAAPDEDEPDIDEEESRSASPTIEEPVSRVSESSVLTTSSSDEHEASEDSSESIGDSTSLAVSDEKVDSTSVPQGDKPSSSEQPSQKIDYEDTLTKAITSIGLAHVQHMASRTELMADINDYIATLDKLSPGEETRFKRIKRLHYSGQVSSLKKKELTNYSQIKEKTDKWQKKYEAYRDKTVKAYDDAYDALAKTWYELHHEVLENLVGSGAAPAAKAAIRAQIEIPTNQEKRIQEYKGLFDNDALDTLLRGILANPYQPVTIASIPLTTDPVIADGSEQAATPFFSIRKKIAMYSKSANGSSERFLFDRTFKGTRAPRINRQSVQIVPQAGPAAAPGPVPAPAPAPAPQDEYADEVGLVSDAKDVNGRFLYSEKNAQILTMKTRKDGRIIHGFFMNGEFITDETGIPASARLSGKNDMSYFARRRLKKQEEAEKLRTAIRTSPFFKHVNSATIQLYAGYQANEDFITAASQKAQAAYSVGSLATAKAYNQAAQGQQDLSSVDAISTSALGYVLGEFIIDIYDNNQPQYDEQTIIGSEFYKYVVGRDPHVLKDTALRLLSENGKPDLWQFGRNIIRNNLNIVDPRTRVMLTYLPEEGMMMRVGLLDELLNHQGTTSEFDKETMSPTDMVRIPKLRIFQEELNSQRGKRRGVLRSILNGVVFNKLLGFALAAHSFSYRIYDADQYKDKVDEKGNREPSTYTITDAEKQRRENESLWIEYTNSMTEGNRVIAAAQALLVGSGAISGAIIGGLFGSLYADKNLSGNAALEGSELLRDYVGSPVIGIANSVKELIKMVFTIVAICQKIGNMNNSANQSNLQSLTPRLDILKDCVKVLTQLTNVAKELCSVIGVYTGIDSLSYKGLADRVLAITQESINIVDAIIDFSISNERKGLISTNSAAIEKAIADYKNNPAPAGGAAPALSADDQMAVEAMNNTQITYFMSLGKTQAGKERMQAGFSMFTNSVAIVRDALGIAAKTTKDPATLIAAATFTLAPYLTEFAGWLSGKIFYDNPNFNRSIATMLGDENYADTPYFDEVLARETGIVSREYLLDLAKIFMTIDSHVLINDPKNTGQETLGTTMMKSFFGNVTVNTMKQAKLADMMRFAGLAEGTNWRSLLRNSLMAKW